MTEDYKVRDYMFDSSNFWEFERQKFADMVIKKNYPDAVLTITGSLDEKRHEAIPKNRRDEIGRHHNALTWTSSLIEANNYCKKNSLLALDPNELQKAKEEAGGTLLEFGERVKKAKRNEAQINEENPEPDEPIN